MTLTRLRSPAGTPRKLICVYGFTSRLPGTGETVTNPSCSAELSRLAGVHLGPHSPAAAGAASSPGPRAPAGPRMRGRMDDIDPKEHRRVDRRTFLKGGLLAGGVIAGAGLAIRAAADTGPDG